MQASSAQISYTNKEKFYHELKGELAGILDTEWFLNLANFSALLKQHLPDINWVGFYLLHQEQLILGPFQGLPACQKIPLGKGVCGTAAQENKTMRIANVDEFPGHISCDAASRSEIVIPLSGKGVLDIDAPILNRFDLEDQKGLESLVKILQEKTHWPPSFL